jgi:threonine/homoserine/homoserine lactone efflux protein
VSDLTEPLVAGLLAGWGVAIPLGAIGVMVVDLGMRAGARPAAAAAAGVATADFLYAAVAATAGAAAAGALEPHAHELRLGAAAVLALVAVLGLRSLRQRTRADAAAAPAGRGVFLRFLALTSINPLTVAYFAALIAGLPAVASAPAEAKAVFVVAAGAASLSWQLVLAAAGALLHRRLPPSARLYTALTGNALVLALAAHMALAA